MGAEKKKLFDRILAIALSMMLVVSLMPLQLWTTYAATDNLTFVVKDEGGNPLEGAKVTITASKESALEDFLEEYQKELTTAADGKVAFEEFTDFGIAGQIYGMDIEYTVEKEGYETKTSTKTLTSYFEVVDVVLELPSIPDGEGYQIRGFNGPYDERNTKLPLLPVRNMKLPIVKMV
ncbi:MAG: Ig-like domain-containing protein [Firmicutes bacterium]|nr:Ig-like domain-containing protein [Bacillota bacterium]